MSLFRPHLEGLETCPHGGPDLAEMEEMGLSADGILDFSVNCNPFGPPPGVKAAAERASWERLPDPQATPLRRALASNLGVKPENIAVG
ncbi:MAG: histidinol-phosphate aminotransferase family protein, partial [Dehalococcoidia bacterium]|nr:histidinol-phosphate aminotransferase family protein [Dehalococcoidia bacterium]